MTQPVDKPKLRTLLIDGNYQMNRCLHIDELLELKAPDGRRSGGVFGLLNTISKLLSMVAAWRCVVVWDGGRSARRCQLFPPNAETGEGYKAHRGLHVGLREDQIQKKVLIKEEVGKQADLATPILMACGVHVFRWPEKEADDVIGHMSRKLTAAGPVTIATDDTDYLQLIDGPINSPNIYGTVVYRPMAEKWVSMENFVEVTGVPVDWYVLKKAIEGDTSDNIPGVEDVGPKTVAGAVRAYLTEALAATGKTITDDGWAQNCYTGFCPPDLTPFFDWCAKSTASRVKKIAAARPLIERNIELVDIMREPMDQTGLDLLLQRLQVPRLLDEVYVHRAMADLGMITKVNNLAEFMKPFRVLQ